MALGEAFAETLKKSGIVDGQGLSFGSMDVDHEIGRIGVYGGHARTQSFGLFLIVRLGGALWIAEAGTEEKHLFLLAGGEIGKTGGGAGIVKREDAIAVDAGEACKGCVQ